MAPPSVVRSPHAYVRPVGEEPDDVLRALCGRCHRAVHLEHDRRWPDDPWPYREGHLANVTEPMIRAGWWRRIWR
jgi:hypothetical protein